MENKSFEFTGTGREFFAIWIVNIALTILTLGIYSAWAKVRTNQYFFGNTVLDNVSFRYTASPIQILKGRLIAFALFMVYFVASNMSPLIAAGAVIILMVLVPAFLVMSMSFKLRNTEYRNIRFNFDKNFKKAYKVFAIPVVITGLYILFVGVIQNNLAAAQQDNQVFGILVSILLLTIALMVPWWEFMITQFKVTHASYGQSEFDFSATTKNYYGMYLKIYALIVAVFVVMGGLFAGIFNNPALTGGFGIISAVLIIIMFVVYFWIFAYMQAKRTNLMYNNLRLNGLQVKSALTTIELLILYITNTLAIMLSLGLLMPWAKVRTARYRASVTSVDTTEGLDRFIKSEEEKQNAFGEEMGDMFDMDLGF